MGRTSYMIFPSHGSISRRLTDWGDKLKLNYTTHGYMLMEIDWGGKFNYTSCGYPKANWQGHEKHPTGH